MFNWLRRFGLPLLCVLIASLAILNVRAFGISYSFQDVVLALLGLIAIDNLAERAGVLDELNKKVGRIDSRLTAGHGDRVVMSRRNAQPRLAEALGEARKEIVIVGPSLDTVVAMSHRLGTFASTGTKIKLLLTAPTEDGVRRYQEHMNFDNWVPRPGNSLASGVGHLRHNLAVLHDAFVAFPRDLVQVRVIDRMIWTSYVIIDPDTENANVSAHMLLYKTPIDASPFIMVNNKTDREWCRFFLDSFDQIWNDARPLQVHDWKAVQPGT